MVNKKKMFKCLCAVSVCMMSLFQTPSADFNVTAVADSEVSTTHKDILRNLFNLQFAGNCSVDEDTKIISVSSGSKLVLTPKVALSKEDLLETQFSDISLSSEDAVESIAVSVDLDVSLDTVLIKLSDNFGGSITYLDILSLVVPVGTSISEDYSVMNFIDSVTYTLGDLGIEYVLGDCEIRDYITLDSQDGNSKLMMKLPKDFSYTDTTLYINGTRVWYYPSYVTASEDSGDVNYFYVELPYNFSFLEGLNTLRFVARSEEGYVEDYKHFYYGKQSTDINIQITPMGLKGSECYVTKNSEIQISAFNNIGIKEIKLVESIDKDTKEYSAKYENYLAHMFNPKASYKIRVTANDESVIEKDLLTELGLQDYSFIEDDDELFVNVLVNGLEHANDNWYGANANVSLDINNIESYQEINFYIGSSLKNLDKVNIAHEGSKYDLGNIASYLNMSLLEVPCVYVSVACVKNTGLTVNQVFTFNIDAVAPDLSATLKSGSANIHNGKAYSNTGLTLDYAYTDGTGSGVSNLILYRDGVQVAEGLDIVKKYSLNTSGAYVVEVIDKVGNSSRYKLSELLGNRAYDNLLIDTSKPIVSIVPDVEPAYTSGDTLWFTKDAGFSISLEEENLEDIELYINDDPAPASVGVGYSFSLNENGKTLIKIIARDKAGNETVYTTVFYLDTAAPVIKSGEFVNVVNAFDNSGYVVFNDKALMKLDVSDEGGSGVRSVNVFADGVEIEPDSEGLYALSGDLNKVTVTVKDNVGNSKTYDIGDIPGLASVTKMLLDTEAPVIDTDTPDTVYQNWYSEDPDITYQFSDDKGIRSADIKINNKSVYSYNYDDVDAPLTYIEAVINTASIDALADGSFKIVATVADLTGKKVSYDQTIRIDKTAPEIKSFIFNGTGTMEGAEIDGTKRYGFFFTGDASVDIYVEDGKVSSGIKSLTYTLTDSAGSVVKQDTVSVVGNVATIVLPENFKGYIEAVVEDNVGWVSGRQSPDGVINSTINPNKISIELPPATYKDNEGYDLYNSSIDGIITVSNSEYGIKTMEWGISSNPEEIETLIGSLSVDKNGNLKGDTASIRKQDENLVLDMRKGFIIDKNENSLYIIVKVTDKLGNISKAIKVVSIDKDDPIVSVDFDDTKASGYYKDIRTATVTIQERNFRSENVVITGAPNLSEWVCIGEDTYQSKVVYDTDGEYQLTVQVTDMASNVSDLYASETFIVDLTAPVISVNFDSSKPTNEIYYNVSRVAQITITEANFSPDLISISAGKLGSWTSDGNVHRNTILFDTDGVYDLVIEGKDIAGNDLETFTSDEFIIDTTAPTIAIEGLIEGKSYKDTIKGSVVISDSYLDENLINVSYENRKVGDLHKYVESSISDKIAKFTILPMPDDQYYDDVYSLVVSVTDKAGNSSVKTVDCTLNKYGSQYDITSGDISGKILNTLPKELVLTEKSVDKIDVNKTTVYITLNGKEYSYDESALEKQVKKTEIGEYEYTYYLKSNIFKDDGKYQLTIVSVAEDGTVNVSKKIGTSEATEFVYDTTSPVISISGIKSGESYVGTEKIVAVSFTDISEVTPSLEVNGTQLTSQDYSIDEYGTYTFTLNQSNEYQSISVMAKDAAGNTGKQTIEGIVIKTSVWDIIESSILTYVYIAIFVIVGIFVLIWWYRSIKRVREDDMQTIDDNYKDQIFDGDHSNEE